MPIYEYVDDNGHIHEIVKSMKDADDLGTVIDHNGVLLKRVASGFMEPTSGWKPYVSSCLPRNLPDCECTPVGKPIIKNREQERNIMAKYGWERE